VRLSNNRVQPTWKDDIAFEPAVAASQTGRRIDISAFTIFHIPNTDNAGSYERVQLNNVIHIVNDLNADFFVDESAASKVGKV
jgi:hypothetical protein